MFGKSALIFAMTICLVGRSTAMELRTIPAQNGSTAVEISGKINAGDADRFFSFVKGVADVSAIILNSPGGSVGDAARIALAIRMASVATVVSSGDGCYSACFYLFAAGTHRYAGPGAKIGVHSAEIDGQETGDAASATIIGVRLLSKWGVPPDIVGRIVQTPPTSIYVLTTADLREMHATPDTTTVSQSPPKTSAGLSLVGLTGTWASANFPASRGIVRLTDFQLDANGNIVGSAVFTGSRCAQNSLFSGRFYSSAMVVAMQLGQCGQTAVYLQPNGVGWNGIYKTVGIIRDNGVIELVRQ